MAAPRCKCGSLSWDAEGRCHACRRFPTLGYLVGQWIEEKCAIPDRDQVGEPYLLTDWQWTFLLNFYRLDPHAKFNKGRRLWRMPFHFSRGGQLVLPQKAGKGPFSGSIVAAEAAGPTVFDGWDADGNPVGREQATPLVQVAASSEDQTDNVWMALLPMITLGDFDTEIPETGLKRIYLPNGGYIEPVTSAARSRLGQRVTFLVQDQTESWTETNGGRTLADTQRRNIAGMGGRWLSTCNAWDPAENSVAQVTSEDEVPEGGVYEFDREPPAGLSVRNKTERRRALKHVYEGSWWVDIDRIDAEIVSLLKRDPAQAERWFLNRKQAAESAAFDPDKIDSLVGERAEADAGSRITIGIDGARFADSLAIVATETETGFQWPLGIWERPPSATDDYEHPLDEVDAVMEDAFERYDVWRVYADPQYIEGLVEKWQGRYDEPRRGKRGGPKVFEWRTNRPRQIAFAVRAYTDSVGAGDFELSPDEHLIRHLKQARRKKVNVYDEEHRQLHTLSKDRPDSPRKIDGAMAAVLSWEARGDCVAAGEAAERKKKYRSGGF